jgi:CRISPR-associated protein Csx14
MASGAIPVDLFNPGQVFACLGFLEAAELLCGGAEGGFDWRDASAPRFVLRVRGEEQPFEAALAFLATATVTSIAPPDSLNSTMRWEIPTTILDDSATFPCPDPSSPATLPAVLTGIRTNGHQARVVIDHWGDKAGRDNVKFWGGSAGYPGARLAHDALELVRSRCGEAAADPFAVAAPQSSSFRFDWRRDYIPIDAGFSLNSHSGNRFTTMGYPLVEIFAAIGLTHARPYRQTKLEYEYGIIGTDPANHSLTLFAPPLLRVALGSDEMPFIRRRFRMRLGWPGKEGQSRAITTVTEETDR